MPEQQLSHVHTYAYDGENNLRLVDNGSTAQYQYGPFNERLFAAWGGQYARYGFDLYNRRSITLVNGSLVANGVQFYAGNQKHAYWTSLDNNFHFEHTDWLGTVRVRTNAVGAVEGSYGSLPFGDGLNQSGSDNNLNHFTGLDADVVDGAGLAHATFREYGSTAGRWSSPDPYMGSYDASNPQSLNRYTYVLNNPLVYTDLDGTSENGPCPAGQYCVYTSPPPSVPTQPSLPAGTVPPGTGPTGGPGNTGGNGNSGGGGSSSNPSQNTTPNPTKPKSPARQQCEQKATQKYQTATDNFKSGFIFGLISNTKNGAVGGAATGSVAGCVITSEIGCAEGLIGGAVIGGLSNGFIEGAKFLQMNIPVLQAAQRQYSNDMNACSAIP